MRNAKGFSVVEVLVAASILAVVLLAIGSLFSTAYSNVGYGGRRTVALAMANQKMEELRDGIFPPSTAGSPETINGLYTRSWTVTVTGAPSQVATTTVTVSWPDAAGGTKQLSLTSMMAP